LAGEAASRAFEAGKAALDGRVVPESSSAGFEREAGAAHSPVTPLVARVLPDVAGFERELDYEVPPELAREVRAGSIVRVPLQGRRVRGWVVAYPVTPAEGLALRPLAKVTGWGPSQS
jgi:hypothetical protein